MSTRKRKKGMRLLLAGILISGMTVESALADTQQGAGTKTSAPVESALDATVATEVGDVSAPTPDVDFTEKWLAGKLQIGTRTVHRFLTDKDSGHKGGTYGTGTYLGTIYALDEVQDYSPTRMFLAYYFAKNLGLEFAYDSITAETVAMGSQGVKTDGDVILAGPTVALLGRYQNSTAMTPYAGIGLGFFNGDFDEDAVWAYTDRGDDQVHRKMVVDDTTALLLTAGTTWAFKTHWLVDMSVQYCRADADAVFYGDVNGVVSTVQPGHFPMDNMALRLGLTYSF